MLSLFPHFLALDGFAPLLLRLTLGLIFIIWGYTELKKSKAERKILLSIFQIVVGTLFIIGLLTQLAALVSIIFFVVNLVGKIRSKAFLTDGVNYYFILLVISLTLLITGPGFIAFDLPL